MQRVKAILALSLSLALCFGASQVVVAGQEPPFVAAEHPYDCDLDQGLDECIDCCTAHAGYALARCVNAGLPVWLCENLAQRILNDCVSRACEVESKLAVDESVLFVE